MNEEIQLDRIEGHPRSTSVVSIRFKISADDISPFHLEFLADIDSGLDAALSDAQRQLSELLDRLAQKAKQLIPPQPPTS